MVGLKIMAVRDSGPLKIAAEVIFGCSIILINNILHRNQYNDFSHQDVQ
jgi:hypothetical protein